MENMIFMWFFCKGLLTHYLSFKQSFVPYLCHTCIKMFNVSSSVLDRIQWKLFSELLLFALVRVYTIFTEALIYKSASFKSPSLISVLFHKLY